jgi:hypothetical protein
MNLGYILTIGDNAALLDKIVDKSGFQALLAFEKRNRRE